MRRETREARPGWIARVEAAGLEFHSEGARAYWDETTAYRFRLDQIEAIEAAVSELHAMALDLVADVVRRGDGYRLGLGDAAVALLEASWRRGDPALYGRMDLAYDGQAAPVLLEYNADTPTALLEASVIQWHWLEDTRAGADQFNRLHEALVERWPVVAKRGMPLHFAGSTAAIEDLCTLIYLKETAEAAGFEAQLIDMSAIGWCGRHFRDLADQPITQAFKLYPWEWMVDEAFGRHIGAAGTNWIEPAWKQVLSNKAVLALLWERHAGHPNLLPAAFDPSALPGAVVRKPLLGREGEGVVLHRPGDAPPLWPCLYQTRAPLFEADGRHAVLGAWVVGDEPVGLGIREDAGWVTTNTARFVPHCIDD